MEFKNEHIVILIIIIITIFFIFNYDVYVLPKNEPLCKPIYVTKKIIDNNVIKKLKKPKEFYTTPITNNNKIKQENIEKKIINNKKNIFIEDENIKEEEIEEENINDNKNIIRKKIIINNVVNILPKIPTKLNNEEIHAIINNISSIYLNSTNLNQFYNNINNSNKLTSDNSNYIKLILYLIDNFDSSLPIDNFDFSLPIDNEHKVNKPLENRIIVKEENDDNMFLIPNSNSPIQNRMMQQASFIR
jgi:hypothetical protein